MGNFLRNLEESLYKGFINQKEYKSTSFELLTTKVARFLRTPPYRAII